MHFYLPWKHLRFPHNIVSLAYANVIKSCVIDRLTNTALWQSATCNYTMVIAFIDTVHRQYITEYQEICICLSCFLFMICFAVFCRWLNTLSLSEVKLITLYYCQPMLVFNWLLTKMVEYVGKRLLLLGLFIYIRWYTFPGTVKGFRSRCLNHTIMS
jgi:hypothetical protein